MHILLTDVLTCPRCGPTFGLIVLADQMDGRHVVRGRLGCANCRSSYRVEDGIADVRTNSDEAVDLSDPLGSLEDRAVRAAALLGAAPAGVKVLLIEEGGAQASEIASHLPEVHLVGMSREVLETSSGELLSRVLGGDRLPFRDEAFRACAILGTPGAELISEALRVLAPSARLVVDAAAEETSEALRSAGAEILLHQDGVVVAAASGRR